MESMDVDHHLPQRSRQAAPEVGVLSRSLLRSPAIKKILPARLYRKKCQNVVFVGEDFFHIKEMSENGHLRHVGTICDFSSRIRAAAVIGEGPKPEPAEGHPPQKVPEEYFKEPAENVPPPQFLVFVLEDPPELRFLIADETNPNCVDFNEHIWPLFDPGDVTRTPGHLLAVDPNNRAIAVAAHENNLMMFQLRDLEALGKVYLDTHGRSKWIPIAAASMLRVEGTIQCMDFLALGSDYPDHVALVLVVASEQRTKILWYTWNFAENPTLKHSGSHTHPLGPGFQKPQLLIPMEHSPSFLLVYEKEYLIGSDAMSRSLNLYGPTEFLNTQQQAPIFPATSSRRPLWTAWSRAVRNVQWIDKKKEAFHIVREDGYVYYFHLENGEADMSGKMALFGGFVDQAFAYCEVDTTLRGPFFLVSTGNESPGQVLKIGLGPNDLLYGLTRPEAMTPQTVETLHNWSASFDMTVSGLGQRSGVGASEGRTSIYTTAMRGPRHGAIAELRLGVEALTKFTGTIESFSGVIRLWAVLETTRDVLLFLSHAEETTLVRLSIATNAKEDDELEGDFNEENCGLVFNRPTLAVAILPRRQIVQVTDVSLQVLYSDGNTLKQFSEVILGPPGSFHIICASISRSTSTVVAALRVETAFALCLVQIQANIPPGLENTDDTVGELFILSSEPTAVAIFELGATLYTAASTADGTLHLLRRGERDTLSPCLTYRLARPEYANSPTICESLTVLHRSVDTESSHSDITCMLVCGMRDGSILTVRLAPDMRMEHANGTAEFNGYRSYHTPTGPEIVALDQQFIALGITPVILVPESASPHSTAFAICGPTLCRLTLQGNGTLHIDEVVSNFRGSPTPRRTPISALCCIANPYLLERADLEGKAVLVSGSTLSIASVDLQPKAVPTLLPLHEQGTPTRLLYLEQLDCMVVASTRTDLVDMGIPRPNWAGKRCTRGQIEFISTADTPPVDENDDSRNLYTLPLYPNEKIFCLLEWKISVDGKKYVHLLVGTGREDEKGNPTGVLYFLSLRRIEADGGPGISTRVVHKAEYPNPVYSVAALGETDFAITTGTALRILRMDAATRKSARLCKYELPSIGLQVTASPPYVYVSTLEDSLMAFEFIEDRTNGHNERNTTAGTHATTSGHANTDMRPTSARLEPIFSDSQARESLHHLHLNCNRPHTNTIQTQDPDAMQIDSAPPGRVDSHPNLILISDKNQSVTGLFCPPRRANQLAAPTLFEAHLPRSIMRLRRGLVRPPWLRPQGSALPQGVLADDIVGVAVDGHVYQFSLLDGNALHVLRTLGGAQDPRHVNGDFLEKLLADGGKGEKSITKILKGLPEEDYEDFARAAGIVLELDQDMMDDEQQTLARELWRWLRMVMAPML
ncbi:hypothetical protein NA57DRAFT_53402 [Rhizodiscina lignyota]|uniref:RSE1/DDB1/CPSF1 first beta-propeller domain-containing protein n=1 Tax=Rhizodiscina lignyota TaxID=1504668 RepID=A0A9P4IH17_9PEZI|nr:hypothetical protein NA57DRAFT_53402 [Rhizodiscina lignyota]